MGYVCNQILSPGVTFIIQLLWQKYTLYVIYYVYLRFMMYWGKVKKKMNLIFFLFLIYYETQSTIICQIKF